jgi:curved DNA-binding protein CbpA
MFNYYSILELTPNATSVQIKDSFKRLAKTWHPDRNSSSEAEERFKLLNEAYQTLSDPDKKAFYDAQLIAYYKRLHQQQEDRQAAQSEFEEQQKEEKQYTFKYSILMLVGFVLIGIASVFLYYFMQNYTAQQLVKEAQELYYQDKSPTLASSKLMQALTHNPEEAEAYFLQGIIAQKEFENCQKAIDLFSAAIKYSETGGAQANYYQTRAQCYEQLRDFRLAIQDYDMALSRQPQNAALMIAIADLYLQELKDYRKAIVYYDRAISQNDQLPLPFLGKSVASLLLQDYENTAKLLDRVEALSPQEPALFYYRGFLLLESQSDTLQACQLWQQALHYGYSDAQKPISVLCYETAP